MKHLRLSLRSWLQGWLLRIGYRIVDAGFRIAPWRPDDEHEMG